MGTNVNSNFYLKPDLKSKAVEVRRIIIESLYASGGGHYGGSLSVADILLVLYEKILNFDPDNLAHYNRDRFILSKGHAAIALYSIFAHLNIVKEEHLQKYGKFGAKLEGHPDMTLTEGVDFSSGSLGQGLSAGIGMALRLKELSKHVWIVLGDGECQEGQVWEAAMFAARYRIDNVHVVIDANGAQEFGFKHDPSLFQKPVSQLTEKWKAFGWSVETVDGHNHDLLENAFLNALKTKNKPSVVIAKTLKGAGVRMFEQNPEHYHCIALSEYEHQQALKELSCKN